MVTSKTIKDRNSLTMLDTLKKKFKHAKKNEKGCNLISA